MSHIYDNGVRDAAARYRFSSDLLKTQMELLVENWVGQELFHHCIYAGRAYRLSFWRTAHGAEVDYVLETPDETIPIEVKATESPMLRDASHLKLFPKTYTQKARRGFIVCRLSSGSCNPRSGAMCVQLRQDHVFMNASASKPSKVA